MFRRFRLETRIVCWRDNWVVIRHRVLAEAKDGSQIVAAVALVRAGLYDRAGKAYVPAARLLAELGVTEPSPQPTPEIVAFLDAEDAMRQAGAAEVGSAG